MLNATHRIELLIAIQIMPQSVDIAKAVLANVAIRLRAKVGHKDPMAPVGVSEGLTRWHPNPLVFHRGVRACGPHVVHTCSNRRISFPDQIKGKFLRTVF